jgi:imidazolonepropionase-like amidohydrolase
MHWHAMMIRSTPTALMTDDVGYTNLMAGAEATDTLMRGFTTVRDVGGPVFGLKRAIDEGLVAGPRIYPSGAMITITGGHGDFRQPFEVPRRVGGPLTRGEQIGGSMIADSPDEVRLRVREQLMLGASQIKLTAGGGVASPHTPVAIQRSIAAGVQCIEHGLLMDDATARLMAEKGTWLSTQPFPEELGQSFPPGSPRRIKFERVLKGVEATYGLAKKYKLKTAFGTDILFSQALAQLQGALLTKLASWYKPEEVLKMATSDNAQLLTLSGPRNPYIGKLGVVEEGALADLLLVDGNPLENLNLVADPVKNFLIIIKDGKVYKNLLDAERSKQSA